MSRNRFRLVGIAAGLAALAATLFPTAALAEVNPDQVPQDLQAAIKAEIESKGHKYAGFCRVVNEQPNVPVGEYCAFVLSIEHEIAEVTYGPVASDEITRVDFVYKDGNWVKKTSTTPTTPTTPANPAPKPPSTGNGVTPDSDERDMNILILAGAAAAAVAGVGALGVAGARKR